MMSDKAVGDNIAVGQCSAPIVRIIFFINPRPAYRNTEKEKEKEKETLEKQVERVSPGM